MSSCAREKKFAVKDCVTLQVCFRGISFDYAGGSYDVGLGRGKEAICLRVEQKGRLEIEDCVIQTEAGAAVVALGVRCSPLAWS